MIRHFVNISGGKDSTATALYVRDLGIEPEYIFADTGHEHPLTMEYLDYLETELGAIRRVRADFSRQMETRRKNIQERWQGHVPQHRIDRAIEIMRPTGIPMLDLSILKGRFPSTRARFCTGELKVLPIFEQCYRPAIEAGASIVSWQGIRADESPSRAAMPRTSIEDPGVIVARPILHWNANTVFNFIAAHGLKPNPLYLHGMSRVGCMPCIMARKSQLRAIAKRFPEEFERLAEWESIVQDASKRGMTTFFAADKTPGTEDTRSNASAVREWALTERGGMQYSLIAETEDVVACTSIYGLCE